MAVEITAVPNEIVGCGVLLGVTSADIGGEGYELEESFDVVFERLGPLKLLRSRITVAEGDTTRPEHSLRSENEGAGEGTRTPCIGSLEIAW